MLLFLLVFIIWNIASDKSAANLILITEFEGIMQPMWLQRYWYVTAYLFLLVLSPVLRRMFMAIEEQEHLLILTARIIYTFTLVPILFVSGAVVEVIRKNVCRKRVS